MPTPRGSGIFPSIRTLAEIEAAAESLEPREQQELLLFLATRLHAAGGALPPPRDIPTEQLEKWIADNEAGYRRCPDVRLFLDTSVLLARAARRKVRRGRSFNTHRLKAGN